jgi:hypothetical protein
MPRAILSVFLAAFVVACGSGSSTRAQRSQSPSSPSSLTAPSLRTAASFSVLGGQIGVSNTGSTSVAGDLGVWPGTAVTGFDGPPDGVVLGTIHVADGVAKQAQSDTTDAYNELSAAGPPTSDLTGQDLAGQTLVAGVYSFTSAALLTGPGVLTLDAQGDSNAVFIFKTVSELTATSGSSVMLINGASPCNVFFKVGSSATIGTGSRFQGNIVALTSIALQTGATLEGRALARNGAVTLDTNRVTNSCLEGGADGGTGGGGTDAGPGDGGSGGTDAGPGDGGSGGTDAGPGDGGSGGIDAGPGDAGSGGQARDVTQCNGVCTDLDLDANNCGACGVRCSASQVCRAGTCAVCPPQDTQCKDQCADLMNDNANCGACGHACAGATSCKNGVCGACDGTVCGNSCVWLGSDSHNCGACGKVCGAGECCVNSQCTGSGTPAGAGAVQQAGVSNTCAKH